MGVVRVRAGMRGASDARRGADEAPCCMRRASDAWQKRASAPVNASRLMSRRRAP